MPLSVVVCIHSLTLPRHLAFQFIPKEYAERMYTERMRVEVNARIDRNGESKSKKKIATNFLRSEYNFQLNRIHGCMS